MASETVTMRGHLIDSGQLARVLDTIMERGADYEMSGLKLGKHHLDHSSVSLQIRADSDAKLAEVLAAIIEFGAEQVSPGDCVWETVDADERFPLGFYSTTNLRTQVRITGTWVDVALPEMDCGVRLGPDGPETVPMLAVRAGDRFAVGFEGVRVRPSDVAATVDEQAGFTFMSSDVSSEKPQGLLVQQVADGMRTAREAGRKVLWVTGPALVHTGSVPATVALIRAGYMQVLFAGNALPTHDIEAALYGTSLGISQAKGVPTEHGHSHHIRAINHIRHAGGIAAAVASGTLGSGIMHACVTNGVEWVFGGSVRDDGPLPEVVTDTQEAQAQMRAHVPDLGYCLVVATMLHGIATGNLLPAEIPLVCVDINPATVTKLSDRGSAHATGIVTDVGLFVKGLAEELAPIELAEELAAARHRAEEHAEAWASGVTS